jgi:N-acetylmuramoyl-L-alanine amidase
MPAVLVEIGFGTNPDEANICATTATSVRSRRAYARSVLDYSAITKRA